MACGDGGTEDADGFVSVGTGDTFGEWELFAEFDGGEFTGCIRMDDDAVRCGDPDEDLVVFENRDGAAYGAVGEDRALEFIDDGREVPLMEGRFFVVADADGIRLVED